MNLLKQIKSGTELRPRRVLLYGIRGIGASTFAASFPRPVFVPMDDSINHIDCHRFPADQRFGQVIQALQELHDEPHACRTVVIDPLDVLEQLIGDEVRRERGVEHLGDVPPAESHALALDYWRELLSALDALRHDRKLTCLLVGRARAERIADATTASMRWLVERHAPALYPEASSLIQSWCDEVLFAACADPAGGPTHAVASPKAATGSQPDRRVIHTTPAWAHAAKNHLGLPPRIPMNIHTMAPCLTTTEHPFVNWN